MIFYLFYNIIDIGCPSYLFKYSPKKKIWRKNFAWWGFIRKNKCCNW